MTSRHRVANVSPCTPSGVACHASVSQIATCRLHAYRLTRSAAHRFPAPGSRLSSSELSSAPADCNGSTHDARLRANVSLPATKSGSHRTICASSHGCACKNVPTYVHELSQCEHGYPLLWCERVQGVGYDQPHPAAAHRPQLPPPTPPPLSSRPLPPPPLPHAAPRVPPVRGTAQDARTSVVPVRTSQMVLS